MVLGQCRRDRRLGGPCTGDAGHLWRVAILSVLTGLISILFGYVLSRLGERVKVLREVIEACSKLAFGTINVIMRLAPIGALVRWHSPSVAMASLRSGHCCC